MYLDPKKVMERTKIFDYKLCAKFINKIMNRSWITANDNSATHMNKKNKNSIMRNMNKKGSISIGIINPNANSMLWTRL